MSTKLIQNIDTKTTSIPQLVTMYQEGVEKKTLNTGTALKPEDSPWRKESKRKFLTGLYVDQLLLLDSPAKKEYEKILKCANFRRWNGELDVYENFTCKSKLCIGCMNKRTFKLIRRYKIIITEMPNLFAQVLTLKNVPCSVESLRGTYKIMQKVFRQIADLARKSNIPFNTIRVIECTIGEDGTLHPHFHLIVENEETAAFIQKHWTRILNDMEEGTCNQKAQWYEPVTEGTINEVIKYSLKILKQEKRGENENFTTYKINPVKADIMYRAMKGIRTLQTTGLFMKLLDSFEETEEQQAEREKFKLSYKGNHLIYSKEERTWINEYGYEAYKNKFNEQIIMKVTH
ncbi:MAG: replication family protein [Microviridae sp.]|nr:MAG: replication family protein [Microviridae sp.]